MNLLAELAKAFDRVSVRKLEEARKLTGTPEHHIKERVAETAFNLSDDMVAIATEIEAEAQKP